jgi:hypothetical protein
MKYLLWLLALLGVVFVALRLFKVIAWSWWWVIAPFLGAGVVFGVCVVIAILVLWWVGNYLRL